MNASTMANDPIAVVSLPVRVPFGFHGIFVPEADLARYAFFPAITPSPQINSHSELLIVLFSSSYCAGRLQSRLAGFSTAFGARHASVKLQ